MRFLRNLRQRQQRPHLQNASFQYLPEELIQEVLHNLHWPTDYYNLSLVCRTLHRHATHQLYATLVVAYHRPERIAALLSLLNTRPDLASLVTTLLFDEDIKSIGPQLPGPGRWPPRAPRRELADGWDPASPDLHAKNSYPTSRQHEAIARLLAAVLPALPNVHRIIVRSLHPSYMHLGLSNADSDADVDVPPRCNLWECLSRASPPLTELFANGVLPRPPAPTLLAPLTTVCISDLFLHVPRHAQQARAWHALLAHTPALHTLGMVRVEHAPLILARRAFPRLVALELFRVFLAAPRARHAPVFIDFLHRHSRTLRVFALSSHLWWSVNHGAWLRNPAIFPNLHTLRLDNVSALLGAESGPDAETPLDGDEQVGADAACVTQIEQTNIIIEFIARRPTILDVGISSIYPAEADRFARFLAATRPMRNVFIGTTANESLRTQVSYTRQYWGYSYEAWAFYKLFEGLTISRSGFRPSLPPRPWKFWKKTPS